MPGRGGGRGGKPLTREVQVSKKLSWLLRHGAESEKLPLQTGGYAKLSDVLANRNLRSLKVTFEEVKAIVKENDKQRFSMIPASSLEASEKASSTEEEPLPVEPAPATQNEIPSDNPADYLIRANQGHSLKIDSEGLLTPLTLSSPDLPSTVVHGTDHRSWPLILASGGLKPMGRNHVHFASGLPAGFKSIVSNNADNSTETVAAAPVISGMRKSSTVLVFLDLKKALERGLVFGRSENGVVLTEGDEQGIVPLELFLRVEDRTGEGVLVMDGKVVKEAPATWGAKKRR